MSAETSSLSVTGELTIAGVAALRESFAERLSQDEEVVVDLSGVDYCDASGLQLLWSLRKSADERKIGIRLLGISPAVRETAAAIGLRIAELSQEGARAASEL